MYNQTIITRPLATPPGVTFPWATTVVPLVISELENLITSRTLSEILATISQKEVDLTSNNDQTIAQLRVELTGQQTAAGKPSNASCTSSQRISASSICSPSKPAWRCISSLFTRSTAA